MSKLIQWPVAKYWDKAWNPVIGCQPCSPACEHCYARKWAERFGQSFEPHEIEKRVVRRGIEHILMKPCPKKGVVFAGNLTDLFGEWVKYPEHYIPRAIDAGETATAILWLTKRAARLGTFLREFGPMQDYALSGWLENQYFGITAEDQELFNERTSDFSDAYGLKPIRMKMWVSCEPLLGPIDVFGGATFFPMYWVVVGCESGPNRRPCKLEWVERIVGDCRIAEVPVFVKQLDIGGKCVTDIEKFPEHLRVRQVPWKVADWRAEG